jgi:hypothetical protein
MRIKNKIEGSNKKILLFSAIIASVYTTIPVIVCEIENLHFFFVLILGLLTPFNTGGYYGVIMFYNTIFAKSIYLVISFFPTWIAFYFLIKRYLVKKNKRELSEIKQEVV